MPQLYLPFYNEYGDCRLMLKIKIKTYPYPPLVICCITQSEAQCCFIFVKMWNKPLKTLNSISFFFHGYSRSALLHFPSTLQLLVPPFENIATINHTLASPDLPFATGSVIPDPFLKLVQLFVTVTLRVEPTIQKQRQR